MGLMFMWLLEQYVRRQSVIYCRYYFSTYFFYTFFSDIDECSLKTDNCDSNAVCANTEGNFTCSCKTGFSGDGHFCAGLYCILGKIL